MNPMCPTNDGVEDTEHFLLLCPSFDMQRLQRLQRQDLPRVTDLLRPFVEITILPSNLLIHLLLYGHENLPDDMNESILELTLRFIHETGWFK